MAVPKTVLLLSIWQLTVSANPQQQTARRGENVTLSCQAPNTINIAAVEWTRPDLEQYVYFQRGKAPLTQDQDPSFINRVQLSNGKMEDGDLSLILKQVGSNDEGTYECRYKESMRARGKRAAIMSDPINVIVLKVDGQTPGQNSGQTPGQTRGHTALILPVIALFGVVILVGLVIFKPAKLRLEKNSDPPADVLQHLQETENGESQTITHNTSDIQV